MYPYFRMAALLLSGAALGVAMSTSASGQSCDNQLRRLAVQNARSTVSAAELRIPRKAWQHFEKARAASEANHDGVFEHEANLALAAAPDFTEVYMLRAARQVQAGQYNTAIETVAAARRIQPEIAWSGIVMASALTELHRYNEAVIEMNRARGPETDSWQWKFERARAEIGRRDVEGALHWSELALDASPAGCTDAHLLRANALQMAGRWEDAISQLDTYLASADQPSTTRDQVLQVLERTRAALRDEKTLLLATN